MLIPHGAGSLEEMPTANSSPALSRPERRIKIHQAQNESTKGAASRNS